MTTRKRRAKSLLIDSGDGTFVELTESILAGLLTISNTGTDNAHWEIGRTSDPATTHSYLDFGDTAHYLMWSNPGTGVGRFLFSHNVDAPAFYGSGANLTALNATQLATGTVPVARVPTAIPAANIGSGTVDNTELGYLNGVTSNIQGQIDGKASASHTHSGADITSGTVADVRLSAAAQDAITKRHNQNTDSGTTGATWTVGNGLDPTTTDIDLNFGDGGRRLRWSNEDTGSGSFVFNQAVDSPAGFNGPHFGSGAGLTGLTATQVANAVRRHHSAVAATTVTNTTTETSLGTVAIAGGTLTAGCVVRIRAGGTISCADGVGTNFALRIKVGSLILTTGYIGLSDGSITPWWFEGDFITRTGGAGGTLGACGDFTYYDSILLAGFSAAASATGSINTTISNNAVATCEFTTADLNDVCTCETFVVEILA